MEPTKILIVDDEADLRTALAEVLEAAGYQVLIAKNGTEGLQMLMEHRPQLTLLDVMMPDISGHEVLQRVRLDEWGKNAQVILLTSRDDTEAISKGIQHGSNDYIVKSRMSLGEIVARVQQHLDGNR